MKKNIKTLTGTVVSAKTEKTIVVQVSYQTREKSFKKIIKRSKKIMVHDADSKAKTGDIVVVRESRPISKRKHYVLDSIVS